MSSNKEQIRKCKLDKEKQQKGDTHAGFYALAFGDKAGSVSEWGALGGNTGTYNYFEILNDLDVILHELTHGLGLDHTDSDTTLTYPDMMAAPGIKTSNYPNMAKIHKEVGSDYVKIGNNRMMTSKNLFTAFEKSKYVIKGNSISIVFDSKGIYTGTIGQIDNNEFDRDGAPCAGPGY